MLERSGELENSEAHEEMQEFGVFLRSLRKKEGLSLKELSRKTKIDRAHLSRVENGLRNLSIESVCTVADVLDFPRYDLLEEAGKVDVHNMTLQEKEQLINQINSGRLVMRS